MSRLSGGSQEWIRSCREGIPPPGIEIPVYRRPSLRDYQVPIYTQSTILRGEETVSPLERPEASIRVADLLPFRRE